MNMIKNVSRLALTTTLCAGPILLFSGAASASGPGWSWNLSRDMLVDVGCGNTLHSNSLAAGAQNNVWSFMEFHPSPPSSVMLPTAYPTGPCWGGPPSLTCWENHQTPNGYRDSAMVGMSTATVSGTCPANSLTHGVPIVHPGPNSQVIVQWQNPLSQAISVDILARFSNLDPCGAGLADGVTWSVRDGWGNLLPSNSAPNPGFLDSSANPPNDTDVFSTSGFPVNPGDIIEFVVDPGSNYYYDGTELDILIVGQ